MNSNWGYSQETPNLGQIRRFLGPCDLEIWRMTLKTNMAPPLCYVKLCAVFRSHWLIQTGVSVRKRANLDQIRRLLDPCDLEIWRMTLKNNKAPLLCYSKLCASFQIHQWNHTGVTVRKHQIWVKIDDFLAVWPCNLTYDLEKQKANIYMLLQALCIIS